MRLKSFRIRNYRSIADSRTVNVEPLTVLLGKNESGKTSLLKALYKLNSASMEEYDIEAEWPRSRRRDLEGGFDVCEAEFYVTEKERSDINYNFADDILRESISILKDYDGTYSVKYDGITNPLTNLKRREAKFNDLVSPHINDLSDIEKSIIDKIKSGIKMANPIFKIRTGNILKGEGIAEPIVADERISDRFVEAYKGVSDFIEWWDEEAKKQANALEYVIAEMPKFIYIDEYSVFRGRANLKEVAARKQAGTLTPLDNTIITIMSLAGLDLDQEAKKVGIENVARRQFDLEDAGRRLSDLLAKRWQQRDFKIEFRVDGDEFLTFIRDDIDGSLIDLEERSKGFQWFLSFDLTFMKETKGEFKNAILLLDEPGLYLHPDAQKDMLRRLEEYSETNTIIYTTHLPFMIELSHPERIRVMNESKSGSYITEDLTGGDNESKLVLQSALGMSGASSYLVAERNLVVEGVHDYWIVTALSNYLKRIGKEGLHNDIFITPAGGASHAVNLATFMVGQKLKTIVLLDSDSDGNKARDALVKNWLIKFSEKSANVIQIGAILETDKPVEIEDVLPPKFYFDAVKERYRDDIAEKGVKRLQLPKLESSIGRDVEALFRAKNIRFSKGSVSLHIRDKINAMTLHDNEDLISSAERLIQQLNSAFEQLSEED